MASSTSPRQAGRGTARTRPSPGQLHTDYDANRNPRFSFMETPLEVQQPSFQQFSSATNSTIDESPVSPREGYRSLQNLPQNPPTPHHVPEKAPVERTSSPYNLQPPPETHPAYYAPVADAPPHEPQPARTTGLSPTKAAELTKFFPSVTGSEYSQKHPLKNSSTIFSDAERNALVYNPNSLAGPNAAVENHRPGQVSHPNAAVEPQWKHQLCELDTLCCTGIFCPCMVYGKTQYRISKKTSKDDPTNMLGYESCNGSCGLMAFACGFQDEREMRDREELIRRHAGPASAAYTSPPTMTYAPPPR
ncbi:MAG: hypothetical protein Q9190_002836 [Brigantiaea leucoxantha]